MTSLELHTGSALVIGNDQDFWSREQKAALTQLMPDSNPSNADLAVFFHQCQRTGLDPFAKQIYLIERQGKQTIQTGIDGFRLIARRSTDRMNGSFGYEDTLWCGEDGKWTDVWLKPEKPRAAKVTVIRDGQRYPSIALWDEYAQTKRSGGYNNMWNTKGVLMLAKCAEALALRKAFPQDLSGLYTSDELGNVVDEEGQAVTDLGERRQARQASSERVEQPKQQGGSAGLSDRLNQQGAPQAGGQQGTAEDALVEDLMKRIEAATTRDALLDLYYEAGERLSGANAQTVADVAKVRAADVGVVKAPETAQQGVQEPLDAETVPDQAAA